jgi:fructose/tagatose bisphosphate aldolase
VLLCGAALRHVFAWQNPFRTASTALEGGAETPAASGRVSILAANANFPVEIQVRAFCQAAAAGKGSPLIVQFSHGALKIIGGRARDPAVSGAGLARFMVEQAVRESRPTHVAVALDHFKVPPYPGDGREGGGRAGRLAAALVDDAREVGRGLLGEASASELDGYCAYLASPAYGAFKREYAATLLALDPAWAMIDTERLPPILDLALTRDVVEFTRRDLGLTEMMLEAEYGATGVAGQDRPYQPLRGGELAHFADEVATFVAYTGADGIAYPIGMEHAAPLAQRHEPDLERLGCVQRRITDVAGRYVPFAQHGGTGAAHLARGLVGKNNVNTHFLVAAANRIADRTLAEVDRIRAGVKEACGTGLYAGAVEAVREAAVDKLKETGTFGAAARLAVFCGEPD